jgi:hypothetical protein
MTGTSYPDGGSASKNYNNYAIPLSITTTTAAAPDPSIVNNVVYDGLGRVMQSQVTSTTQNIIYADTTYDSVGRTSASLSAAHRRSDPPRNLLGNKPAKSDQASGSEAPVSSDPRTIYEGRRKQVNDSRGH